MTTKLTNEELQVQNFRLRMQLKTLANYKTIAPSFMWNACTSANTLLDRIAKGKCLKHPYYKAMRKPTTKCAACLRMWKTKCTSHK